MGQIQIFNSQEIAFEKLPEGQPRKVIVHGVPYCFVRIRQDIRAFSDLCPHQRANLSQGIVTSYGEIVCPLHQYRFDLQRGEESSLKCESLQFFETKVTDNGVFLYL